jgi:hypothetical protein
MNRLRAAFASHGWSAPVAGLITALVAVLVSLLRPAIWRAQGEVVATEPVVLTSLVSPFAALPAADLALSGLPERLTSHQRLVALAKGAGLIDRFSGLRPPLLRLRDAVEARLRGPMTEPEVLEAVVELLRERVTVTVSGRRVSVEAEWTDPDTALALASAELDALTHGLVDAELDASLAAAASTDSHLAEVRLENAQRLQALVAERAQRPPRTGAGEEALREGRARQSELEARAEEGHLALEVARAASLRRYLVLELPHLPRHPVSGSALRTVLLWLFVVFLSALAAPVGLSLTSAPAVAGRSLQVPARLANAGLLGVAALTGLSTGLADGHLSIAVLPLAAALGLYGLWRLPLRWPLLGLMLASFICDDPTDRAYLGRWQTPFFEPGRVLFTNIAWFTGFELCLFGLAALFAARRVLGLTLDPVEGFAPRPLRAGLLLSLGTLTALLLLGLVSGGEFRQALWQLRFLAMLPLVALLALHAFEVPRDLRVLLLTLLVGSLIKACLGIWFMLVIVPTLDFFPPHTSGHNDTMLFVVALVAAVALWWERPTGSRALLALVWVPVLVLALRYNDRRIAYVELASCAAVLVLLSPRHAAKRALLRGSVVMGPLAAGYLLAGWNQEGVRGFGPAQTVRSLIAPVEGSKHESSNVERDIENYNLIRSWAHAPLTGRGFGHAFTEYLPSNDFSQSNYGHVGHNSLLWLLWIGGVFGFLGVLLYLAVALYFFARTLRRARAPDERAALLVAASALIVYVNQSYGDMGTQSIQLDFFVAAALTIIGGLTTRARAWPEAGAALPPSLVPA